MSGGDDQRNGVTAATHLVLDRLDAVSAVPLASQYLLAEASKSVAAALRADPMTGIGRRRVQQAREAAALLLLALNRMDAAGREVRADG